MKYSFYRVWFKQTPKPNTKIPQRKVKKSNKIFYRNLKCNEDDKDWDTGRNFDYKILFGILLFIGIAIFYIILIAIIWIWIEMYRNHSDKTFIIRLERNDESEEPIGINNM